MVGLLTAFTALILLAAPAAAVPPLHREDHPADISFCRVNPKAVRNRVAALRLAPRFAAPISSTAYSVAVIRVDFSDETMTKTQAETESFIASVKSYYLENSYNYLTVNGTVSSLYRMPRTHDFYADGLSSDYSTLARDAIAVATTAGFNFSSYDHVMIYHAGEGAETANSPSNYIWSAYLPAGSVGGPAASGKTFDGVTFVPESEFFGVDPLGVICHEYGHQLGLPDLYNTADNQSAVVGYWSLMDTGIYIGSPLGSNPSHLDPWSKQYLGFSSPETVSFTAGSVKTLTQVETPPRTSVLRVPISVSSVGEDNEYFLMEYRRTSGGSYDTALPGQGLLVWHVDDSIMTNATRLAENTVNSEVPHRGLDLVEADADDPSSTPNDPGDSTDPWGANQTFQDPKARAYNGGDSGIAASDISSAGSASISLTLRTALSNPAIADNTAGGTTVVTGGAAGYVNPSKGESALIGVLPSQSGAVTVKIYSLAGNLVKESTVQGTAGQNTIVPWNGKNPDGEAVASGIYLIHVRGGGIDQVKKAAVIK